MGTLHVPILQMKKQGQKNSAAHPQSQSQIQDSNTGLSDSSVSANYGKEMIPCSHQVLVDQGRPGFPPADPALEHSGLYLAVLKRDEPLRILLVFWELAAGNDQSGFISGY